MKKRIRQWIRFTEETNALDYLERAGEFMAQTESSPRAWKWVILALHGALHGFAIAACKYTNHETVVRKDKKGVERLISLDEALRKCTDPAWMGTLYGAKALELTPAQKDSIQRLKKGFRNSFEHFPPLTWLIEIHGFPRIAMDVLDIIRFLAVETVRYQHLNQTQRRHVKSIVYQSKKLLKASRLHRELLAAEADKGRPGKQPRKRKKGALKL